MVNSLSIQLPKDVVIYFSYFLGQKEVARCERVCKKWKEIFASDPVWKNIYKKKKIGKAEFTQELSFKQKCKLAPHRYPQLVELVKRVEAKALEIKKGNFYDETPIDWKNGKTAHGRPWMARELTESDVKDNESLTCAMQELRLSKTIILAEQSSDKALVEDQPHLVAQFLQYIEDDVYGADSATIRKLHQLAVLLSPNKRI